MTAKKISVGILDDHLATTNGYRYTLEQAPQTIKVIWTAEYYDQALKTLAKKTPDILILDASVPTSPNNPTTYPIFNAIPEIRGNYPNIKIMVISMHNRRAFITNLVKIEINAYIMKNDTESIENLPEIVHFIHNEGVYYSPQAQEFLREESDQHEEILTARQLEYLSYFNAYPNLSTEEIAKKLEVAPSTVRNTLSNIYVRLKVNKLPAAIEKVRQLGMITPNDPPHSS